MRRHLGTLTLVGGALTLAAGLVGIGGYVYGVIDTLDEADRSWIFWGLVFLFGGILLARGGLALILLGRAWRAEAE